MQNVTPCWHAKMNAPRMSHAHRCRGVIGFLSYWCALGIPFLLYGSNTLFSFSTRPFFLALLPVSVLIGIVLSLMLRGRLWWSGLITARWWCACSGCCSPFSPAGNPALMCKRIGRLQNFTCRPVLSRHYLSRQICLRAISLPQWSPASSYGMIEPFFRGGDGKTDVTAARAAGMVAILLWLGKNGIHDYTRVSEDVASQQANNAKLKARNDQLFAEIDDLNGGSEAIEERTQRAGHDQAGETFYRLVPDQNKRNAQQAAQNQQR